MAPRPISHNTGRVSWQQPNRCVLVVACETLQYYGPVPKFACCDALLHTCCCYTSQASSTSVLRCHIPKTGSGGCRCILREGYTQLQELREGCCKVLHGRELHLCQTTGTSLSEIDLTQCAWHARLATSLRDDEQPHASGT